MEIEIWKDIIGFSDYQISNLGNVKSKERFVNNNGCTVLRKSQTIRQYQHHRGYFRVRLFKNKIGKNISIHRLIAINFLSLIGNKNHVNHINGIKTDNRIENLEWCTHSENIQHAWDTGLCVMTKERADCSKKNRFKRQVIDTVTNEIFESIKEAAKNSKYSKPYIGMMLNGKYKNKTNLIYK